MTTQLVEDELGSGPSLYETLRDKESVKEMQRSYIIDGEATHSAYDEQPKVWPQEVRALLSEAKAMLVAVTYGGISNLPNDAGEGYMARIPEGFVTKLEAAIKPFQTEGA